MSEYEPITPAGDPLDAVIADYLQQVEAGAVPDREALLQGHPDLADRHRAFHSPYLSKSFCLPSRLRETKGIPQEDGSRRNTSDAKELTMRGTPVKLLGCLVLFLACCCAKAADLSSARDLLLGKWESADKKKDLLEFTKDGKVKLGVDEEGIVLIYEVEAADSPPATTEELTRALKRRIDPADLYNVTIRPAGRSRVEIILPIGNKGGRRAVTAEDLQQIKQLISQTGSLEFRILANENDDRQGIDGARAQIEDSRNKTELQHLAEEGKPPSPPTPPPGKKDFTITLAGQVHCVTYSWVELGRQQRHTLGLHNAAEATAEPGSLWKQAATARVEGKALRVLLNHDTPALLYSRKCLDKGQPREKKYEYFILSRDPEQDGDGKPRTITGKHLRRVWAGKDDHDRPMVQFQFDEQGSKLLQQLTGANLPTGSAENRQNRLLAILLDGQVMVTPTIRATVNGSGQITGSFQQKEVDDLVRILRAGALPATLKPQPVSEVTVGPSASFQGVYKLGEDGSLEITLAVGEKVEKRKFKARVTRDELLLTDEKGRTRKFKKMN